MIRQRRRIYREWLALYGPAVVATCLGFFFAYRFVEPAPPDTITLAGGSAGGAYQAFATLYRNSLANNGIEVTIVETAGSVENLALLESGEADIAFIQGGTGEPERQPLLRGLASLYYEPLWVLSTTTLDRLQSIAGLRVSLGLAGSGTRLLAERLLAANGILTVADQAIGSQAALAGLLTGTLDVAFLVASPEAEWLETVFEHPEVQLMHFQRVEAYSRRFPFLSAVTMPEGTLDLGRNFPRSDTALLAATANLVVHRDFHPALAELLLNTAVVIHHGPSILAPAGTFPSERFQDFPLHETAVRYFDRGPSFLQRLLPFWAASLMDRLTVMLLPLLTLAFPLLKVLPPTYRWRVRSKIYRWYRKLQDVEQSLLTGNTPEDCLAELDRIETDVRQVLVPLAFAHDLYHLRLHIEMIRSRVLEQPRDEK